MPLSVSNSLSGGDWELDEVPVQRRHPWAGPRRNISARIMINCLRHTVGRRTFGFSRSTFVERLIGTTRREFLDQVLFWNGPDLERKLAEFQVYDNAARSHASLDGRTPLTFADGHAVACAWRIVESVKHFGAGQLSRRTSLAQFLSQTRVVNTSASMANHQRTV